MLAPLLLTSKQILSNALYLTGMKELNSMTLNAMAFDGILVEELMNGPLPTFITLSANDSIYSGNIKDPIP